MSDENEINLKDVTLAFDQGKQAAIYGWCLKDKKFAMQCSYAVQPEWFSSAIVGKLFAGTMKLLQELGRMPTPDEVKQHRPFLQESAQTKQRLDAALEDALKKTEVYGLDLLRREMTDWMHAVVFYKSMTKAGQLYNAFKVREAWETVERAMLLRATSTFEDGTNKGFESSAERIKYEREERMLQAPKVLKYGVSYLDDCLGGIIPNDLIVLGAKTGAGKTQLATSIALANAKSGVPVHYFALEAEQFEIERRIKYGMVADAYYSSVDKKDWAFVNYIDWRMGKLDHVLRRFEDNVEKLLSENLKNLHTLYRTSGTFDLNALEKGLLQVVPHSRLIVIDHLHYVDTDDDENRDYKKIIKLIRDIVLRFGVPIIVVAHLRKTQVKGAPLINSIEDFHGTSDVPKVATTCIMLGPANDQVRPDPLLFPTYVAAVKSRLDGSRTRFTALTYFDQRQNRYAEEYKVGRMIAMNQEWEELAAEDIPAWARVEEIKTKGLG